MLILYDMNGITDSSSWDMNADFWDQAMGDDLNEYHRKTIRPYVLELLGPIENETVLDIACGNGSFSALLDRMGADVTAFDFSEKMIEIATARWKDSNVRFLICDAADEDKITQLGSEKFSKAVSTMALMDIADIKPLAKALRNVLKPGGIFVCATQHPCFITLTDRYMTEHSYEGEALDGQPVKHLYFHRSLHDLLSPFFDNGFMIDALWETCFKDKERPEVLIIRAVLAG